MARPTRVQVVQMAVLSILIFVGFKVAFGLLAFAISVATGAWAG